MNLKCLDGNATVGFEFEFESKTHDIARTVRVTTVANPSHAFNVYVRPFDSPDLKTQIWQRVERPEERVERPDGTRLEERVERPEERVERPEERVERPEGHRRDL